MRNGLLVLEELHRLLAPARRRFDRGGLSLGIAPLAAT